MTGPLQGITIVEFTQIIAAPFGGMLLSDMGANVIKIEPIGGEPWRLHNEFIPKESKTYMGLNRGKKSIPLDLTAPESTEIISRLISKSDVVIINSRPDVAQKLGIDYETLSKINPSLIYCDNTAFGRNGPDKNRPGYDIIIQAMSGLMASDNKIENGVPQQITASAVADYSTGITIAWGICAALFSRERTGKGQKLETSLLSSALAIQGEFFEVDSHGMNERKEFVDNIRLLRSVQVPYESLLEERQNYINRGPDFKTYYTTYQTKDQIIAIGCLSNHLRKKAAEVIGLDDPRFRDNYDPSEDGLQSEFQILIETARKKIAEKDIAYWLRKFDEAGVPAGPVRFVEELFDDPQVLLNDNLIELCHEKAGKIKMFGPIIKMSETPLSPKIASPPLGFHTDEILKMLGYSDTEISKLKLNKITE